MKKIRTSFLCFILCNSLNFCTVLLKITDLIYLAENFFLLQNNILKKYYSYQINLAFTKPHQLLIQPPGFGPMHYLSRTEGWGTLAARSKRTFSAVIFSVFLQHAWKPQLLLQGEIHEKAPCFNIFTLFNLPSVPATGISCVAFRQQRSLPGHGV
jgi:hypothetical protein